MHQIDRKKVHKILHDYKLACYHYQHSSTERDQVSLEAQRFADEILATNFHYEFRKPINPERAEIFGMIENYVREAVLPPVVNMLAERIVALEKRQTAGIRCLEQLIELVEEAEEVPG